MYTKLILLNAIDDDVIDGEPRARGRALSNNSLISAFIKHRVEHGITYKMHLRRIFQHQSDFHAPTKELQAAQQCGAAARPLTQPNQILYALPEPEGVATKTAHERDTVCCAHFLHG